MPDESLWVAFPYADAYCYRGAQVYTNTKAASHTAASPIAPVAASLCEAETWTIVSVVDASHRDAATAAYSI